MSLHSFIKNLIPGRNCLYITPPNIKKSLQSFFSGVKFRNFPQKIFLNFSKSPKCTCNSTNEFKINIFFFIIIYAVRLKVRTNFQFPLITYWKWCTVFFTKEQAQIFRWREIIQGRKTPPDTGKFGSYRPSFSGWYTAKYRR